MRSMAVEYLPWYSPCVCGASSSIARAVVPRASTAFCITALFVLFAGGLSFSLAAILSTRVGTCPGLSRFSGDGVRYNMAGLKTFDLFTLDLAFD